MHTIYDSIQRLCAIVITLRLSVSSTEMKFLFDWKFIKWERRLFSFVFLYLYLCDIADKR